MKLNFDSPGEDARIEILPLIDVIFCILTFFILGAVSLTRQSAIGVDLPGASTGSPQMREMLLVSLDPIGQLYFEQNPVSRQQLSELLIQEKVANPRKLVVLYASRSARYDQVVDILDLLRSIGGDRVALATLPESRDQDELNDSDLNDFSPNLLDPSLLQPDFSPFEQEDGDSRPLLPGDELLPDDTDLRSPTIPGLDDETSGLDAPSPSSAEQLPSLQPELDED